MAKLFLHTFQTTLITVIMSLMLTTIAGAQVKYEREFGVRASAVPAEARAFVAACFNKAKIRWYKEINIDTYTFEAKIKLDGCAYSIEFDSTGTLQDVEVLTRFDCLAEPTRAAIDATLTASCSPYDVQRIQRQWTGTASALQELIRTGVSAQPYVTRFELVYRCGKGRAAKLYETLFDDTGKVIQTHEIIPRNTDNLDF